MKKQPTQWEKIFANEMTNKGLISKTQKKLTQLDSQKVNKLIKKNKN